MVEEMESALLEHAGNLTVTGALTVHREPVSASSDDCLFVIRREVAFACGDKAASVRFIRSDEDVDMDTMPICFIIDYHISSSVFHGHIQLQGRKSYCMLHTNPRSAQISGDKGHR